MNLNNRIRKLTKVSDWNSQDPKPSSLYLKGKADIYCTVLKPRHSSKQDLDRIESANIIAITVTVTSSSSLLSLAPAVTHSLPPLLPLSQIPARPHFRSPLLPLSFTYALPHYRSHSLPLSLTPALTHSRSPSLPLSITFAKGTSTSRLWFLWSSACSGWFQVRIWPRAFSSSQAATPSLQSSSSSELNVRPPSHGLDSGLTTMCDCHCLPVTFQPWPQIPILSTSAIRLRFGIRLGGRLQVPSQI